MKGNFMDINKIVNKYKDKIIIIFYEGNSLCYRNNKIIFLSNKIKDNPIDDNIFEMLHEIGHILNNDDSMKKCEREYNATVWAIKESKKYRLNISNNCKKLYQNYINGFARNRKTISVKDVQLCW
jgi:hypothetical protein